jgi:hypothetical protein
MFKGHYNSIRGESRKLKSVESWVKYVGSKLFPSFVVTLWSSAKELDDFDLITPSMNHSWYYEPQLEKLEIRVNHNLELRRPIKIYRDGSENLNGFTTCVESVLRW